ncbi:FliM/FliN family flagellar motor switch protein [Bradyrhizobium sp. STM 3557]|uniref:FliM/FliN family flagellar motor switch protein n=1 Tax=Bradyrhizobium sp. STM 3557 TaxID=578920 RepID=UPI003891080E
MMHRAFAFPEYSRVEAAARRARSVPRRALKFDEVLLGGKPSQLSVDERQRDQTGDQACMALTWGVDRLELRCPESLPRDVLAALDPSLEIEVMSPDLAALLLEAALLPRIRSLELATGRDITIGRLKTASSEPCPHGLRLLLENETQCWHLLLSTELGHGGPDPLATLLEFWPVKPRDMSCFNLPMALRIGSTQLSHAALLSLQLGDAVLLQSGDGRHGMLVIAESWTAMAERHAQTWRLLEAPGPAAERERTEWTMRSVEAIEVAPEGSSVSDPDQLPVQLMFDVGRLEMTLAELRVLGRGSIVELGRRIVEPVRISAQGRPVGWGELVDVDGLVGVKVTRLFDYE